MFRCIVVAVDGSEHSHRALESAKALAECFDSTLFLVHAFPHTSDLIGYEQYEKLISRRENAGQTVLDDARRRFGETTLQVDEELLEGPPAEAILSVAKARHADLIIMGTRGLGELSGLLMGSVSHKVMHFATCPVLVVR